MEDLTEEQIQEIKEKIATMSPEELEELKKKQAELIGQQGGECPFCLMGKGQIPTKKVYEDNEFLAILDINPANKGHVLLIPKEHVNNSLQLNREMTMKLYFLANEISKRLVEVVKAEGVNLFVANGGVAGQRVEHLMVHIIPRFNNDKISFLWDAKKIDEKEFDEIVNGFSSFNPEQPNLLEKDSPKEEEEVIEDYQEPVRTP